MNEGVNRLSKERKEELTGRKELIVPTNKSLPAIVTVCKMRLQELRNPLVEAQGYQRFPLFKRGVGTVLHNNNML